MIMGKLTVLIGLIFLLSCGPEEEMYDYPRSPYIELNDLYWDPETFEVIADFNFSDFEGDFGLRNGDWYYPYHRNEIIVDNNGTIVLETLEGYVPPFYAHIPVEEEAELEFLSNEDPRPSPYDKCAYDWYGFDEELNIDYFGTSLFHAYAGEVLVRRNPDYFNAFFEVSYREKGSAVPWKPITELYKELGDNAEYCWEPYLFRLLPFDDTIIAEPPWVRKRQKIDKYTWNVEVSIFYSQFIQYQFQFHDFKVKFHLQDRGFNKTNIIEAQLREPT